MDFSLARFKVNGKQMDGHLFFHLGDDSGFTAKKTR